ncbi:hypothetical protein ACYBRX_17540, partial [Klebsiella pneumoniae]
ILLRLSRACCCRRVGTGGCRIDSACGRVGIACGGANVTANWWLIVFTQAGSCTFPRFKYFRTDSMACRC